ncbi:hypothetical protein C8R43DRAFT_1115632 [Mycena crocata]|nr:hypothetical protein C8R43DRAFT_1115632 [Mycena crocata]
MSHEGVGTVQQVGDEVKGLNVGDVVGWGYTHKTCGACEQCIAGQDNYCMTSVMYGSHTTDQRSFGSHAVWDSSFLFKIPAGIAPEDAAPLISRGIAGVGGLVTSIAIQFLAKMEEKRDEALSLGASEFYATNGVTDLSIVNPLDHLLVTTSFIPDWKLFLEVMKPLGRVYLLTFSDDDLVIPAMRLLSYGLCIQGSALACRSTVRKMLYIAALQKIKPVIERFPMTNSRVEESMAKLREGCMRYRGVLIRLAWKMNRQNKLNTIPADIQHHLLSLLPDFIDLGAVILAARSFHDIYKAHRASLIDQVAKNLVGSLFAEATLLARRQEEVYNLGDESVKGFSSNTVILVVNNDYVVRSLEYVIFGLLNPDSDKFDIYEADSLARFVDSPFTADASPTESIRFQAAAYKFWRFCLEPKKARDDFLQKFTPNDLLEMAHFVKGVSNLIHVMRGHSEESDPDSDWDFLSSVLSTGPENILNLWDALQRADPDFDMELGEAGSKYDEEGFFTYSLYRTMEHSRLDEIPSLHSLGPIFDDDHQKMVEILAAHATPEPTDIQSWN